MPTFPSNTCEQDLVDNPLVHMFLTAAKLAVQPEVKCFCLSVSSFVRVRFTSEELPNISVVKSKMEEFAEHLAENVNKLDSYFS